MNRSFYLHSLYTILEPGLVTDNKISRVSTWDNAD
jgi:hypothetical protein